MSPRTMRAMLFERTGQALRMAELPVPSPAPGQILLRVEACGVCRTDLHLIDGELPDPVLPMVPGHEIVGRVVATGSGVAGVRVGQRMGVPWLGWTSVPATSAPASVKTCVTTPASPATRSMAAMPNTPSPMRATASRCPMPSMPRKPRRCCAPA